MRSDLPSFDGYERGDLAGVSPGRAFRHLDAKRARREADARAAALLADPTAYFGPPCDRPAPPEALAAQIAAQAEGPGAPGDPLYLSEGGPGIRRRYREARATFYWKGGGRGALEAAAEHGSWETLEMIRLLLAEGDLTPREAADLAEPSFEKLDDYRDFCVSVRVCSIDGCEMRHARGGRCRKHYDGGRK